MLNSIYFEVDAIPIKVKSRNKITGKLVNKLSDRGLPVYAKRIIPKGRPRFAYSKSGKKITYTPENTSSFEKHIKDCFFKEYGDSGKGIINDGKIYLSSNFFLGCKKFGDNKRCVDFRKGRNFEYCKKCKYRRKNLSIELTVMLKDNRHIDGDNILKVVLDSLNRVCFYDDTQFCRKFVEIIPNCDEEKLCVNIGVVKENLRLGSLVGGYDVLKFGSDDAKRYVLSLLDRDINIKELLNYFRKIDKRKYLNKFKD